MASAKIGTSMGRSSPSSERGPAGDAVPSTLVRRTWTASAFALAAFVLLFGLLFWQEVAGAYRVWVASRAYNHAFLVLPIAGYMIWSRRAWLAGVTPRLEPRALLLLPLLSLAWLAASTLGVLEGRQFIVMTMLQIVLFSTLGPTIYRRLLGPLLYLYFLVPSGEFLVPYLQDFTAHWVTLALRWASVPVYSDGIFIEVPAGKFVVAEACAGLRFLIAAIAFGVFFALIMYSTLWKRVAFVVLSILVPLVANVLRVFGIILLAEIEGSAAAVEADHVTYGWVFFAAVQFGLILIGRLFADRALGAPPPLSPRALGLGAISPLRVSLFLGTAFTLAALGPAYGMLLDRHDAGKNVTCAEAAKPPAAPWRRVAAEGEGWKPKVIGADCEFIETFTDGGSVVRRFLALYVPHGLVSNLVRSQNRLSDETLWRSALDGQREVRTSGGALTVNAADVAAGERRLLVWSFYVEGGAPIASPLLARLHQARAILLGQRRFSAFVALAADMPDATAPPLKTLTRFLDAMAPLSDYGKPPPAGTGAGE